MRFILSENITHISYIGIDMYAYDITIFDKKDIISYDKYLTLKDKEKYTDIINEKTGLETDFYIAKNKLMEISNEKQKSKTLNR